MVIDERGSTTDEESGQTLSDLSDVISSDFGADDYKIHSGSVTAGDGEQDPYNKIKLHASLSLRNLFKNNSKVLYNYWYLLFPSFMMRQQPEFNQYLQNFENLNVQKEFMKKVFPILQKHEPTLFFVIMQDKSNSQLKSSIYATIQSLLENSQIQKSTMELEKANASQKEHKSFF